MVFYKRQWRFLKDKEKELVVLIIFCITGALLCPALETAALTQLLPEGVSHVTSPGAKGPPC